ncbi:MAG: ATP phosphoribosyltransferase [Bacteroidia bacterium]|nr:ATP phosphoribosyltransferase [Bacteroidia bacterium]MCX7651803.1 ATP phosphoribosyltransferase [Bacteroidia bacterium]MDW8417095.1 ATP phosphoribosyltransferase [Bacteroidia bacterium]
MKRIRIALQKKGRLAEDSFRLLSEAGIIIPAAGERLRVPAINYPLEAYLLRDDDIPAYVADGVADIGIVGENVVYESGQPVEIIRRLGFGRCRLSLAVPKDSTIQSIEHLHGKRVATGYPRLTHHYLSEMGIKATIHALHGSTEIAPSLGLAEAIIDIVATGSTLLLHGLREIHTFLHSEAILIQRRGDTQTYEDFLFRIDAVLAARQQKYILFNLPESALPAVLKLLPGLKSPTVMPLAEPGWISVHTVVEEKLFWEIAQQLQGLGAQGLLVMNIEKLIR